MQLPPNTQAYNRIVDLSRRILAKEQEMRSCIAMCLLVLGCIGSLRAEESAPPREPMAASYTVRTGEQFQGPYVQTYRLFEYSQQRGRWVLPDLGDYDFGQGGERYLFAGAGAEFRPAKNATLTQIVYFSQAVGPGSQGARFIWVWPVLDLSFTPRLTAEAVVYPSIPLNGAAQAGFDVDRAKVEYAVRRKLIAGAGYSGSICKGEPWKNKPFLTTTVSTRAGSFEFWLQRMPGGGQIQMRYQLVHSDR
jgi:hypothetical protein